MLWKCLACWKDLERHNAKRALTAESSSGLNFFALRVPRSDSSSPTAILLRLFLLRFFHLGPAVCNHCLHPRIKFQTAAEVSFCRVVFAQQQQRLAALQISERHSGL